LSYYSQIHSLQYEIQHLNYLIGVTEENIRRLKKAKATIENEKDALNSNRTQIHSPELSSNCWAGKHANSFLDKRENIQVEFYKMINEQISKQLTNISEAISQSQANIACYFDSIVKKQNQIERIRDLIHMEEDDH